MMMGISGWTSTSQAVCYMLQVKSKLVIDFQKYLQFLVASWSHWKMIFLCSVLKGNSFEAWYKSGFPNLPALDLVGDVSLQTEIFDVLSFVLV